MTNERHARLEWFRNAKFGLFMHYGLYSLLGRGEWVQLKEKIHVDDYEKLKDRFTAENFDADRVTDLALAAGMQYVNLTTMHHDGFCLFDTKETDFNSVQSLARRDLVAELAEACHRKGLGLCLYYSHGRHWRHPHAMSPPRYGASSRPAYDEPEPRYATGADHDIGRYVATCKAQMTELLTHYGPVANIWFDGWGTPRSGPWQEELQIPELYAHIRSLQPGCLISYKLGLTGGEDFFAPEYHWPDQFPELMQEVRDSGKPVEICHHIAGWGYTAELDGQHRGADSVMDDLAFAASHNANLLLNVAPRGDGSFDDQDVQTLREVGERLDRKQAE